MHSILRLFVFLLPLALATSNSMEPETLLSSVYFTSFLLFAAIWIMTQGLSLIKFQAIKSPLLLIALLLTVATTFSIEQAHSLAEISKYITGLILFLIVASLREEEKKRIIPEIVLSAFVISLLAIYQYFWGFQLLTDHILKMKITDPFILEKIAQKRVFFPFPTPGILGGYLAMILPLAFSSKRKIFFLIPLTFALVVTQSLTAFLSLTLVAAVFSLWRTRISKKKTLALLAMGMVLGGLIVLRTANPQHHLLPTFSLTARIGYWKEAWEIIRSHPLTGVGFGNFDIPGVTRYAHNSYLQLWAETGIAGIISFLWLVTAVLKNGWEGIRNSCGEKQRTALAAGILIFLVHNLVDFTFFLPAVSGIAWVMLGLLYSPAPQRA